MKALSKKLNGLVNLTIPLLSSLLWTQSAIAQQLPVGDGAYKPSNQVRGTAPPIHELPSIHLPVDNKDKVMWQID
jgi:hypothetical protein